MYLYAKLLSVTCEYLYMYACAHVYACACCAWVKWFVFVYARVFFLLLPRHVLLLQMRTFVECFLYSCWCACAFATYSQGMCCTCLSSTSMMAFRSASGCSNASHSSKNRSRNVSRSDCSFALSTSGQPSTYEEGEKESEEKNHFKGVKGEATFSWERHKKGVPFYWWFVMRRVLKKRGSA